MRSFLSLIFSFLLAIPLLAAAVRTLDVDDTSSRIRHHPHAPVHSPRRIWSSEQERHSTKHGMSKTHHYPTPTSTKKTTRKTSHSSTSRSTSTRVRATSRTLRSASSTVSRTRATDDAVTSSSASTSTRPTRSSTSEVATETSAVDTELRQHLALELHNELREQHSAPDLVWNNTLADAALVWAKRCKFTHGGGEDLDAGENISAYTGGYNATLGISMWIDEEVLYDYSDPGYSDATGHYTQMVWKSTTSLGCSEVFCPSFYVGGEWQSDWWFTVCEYYPPGNIVDGDYFEENVLED
ncbi:hypothetical protein JCM8097_005046 [Rhodosporidiobolus ruineniae]